MNAIFFFLLLFCNTQEGKRCFKRTLIACYMAFKCKMHHNQFLHINCNLFMIKCAYIGKLRRRL